ncbi:DUF4153 domain-containing protein [Citrobacter portucalensis]|uniref:DUF4153 domain-containing protein n=1 Tax=Citrobacter portucalensis TaxID=1639133 RepID=UPI001C6412C1|nr:DUF4153 domain-containing protein [Citrobacter portucalensis]MBW7620843.1 DUF4153 domain-containing protein [Citrobacter portucalensis]MBW7640013.1 DUF4153 domain-containing protein [Citrobacter portucalensis]MCA2133974.1 DUF4153 domain-containing protein [Citrobacter portucalensis]MCA2144727.1 DUF4153 domain-containing protein [Citrobacter portucalensis]MCA2148941.1 DUF4153 domain-containing protein [Citrobacter portucalensis]
MDSAEISRTTRWGMIFIGLLQGTLCYLLMTYLAPHNDGWLFYGMPATIAITSALLLTVVSFKQRALWYWMALIFAVVLAMSVWLKWQVEDSDKWRQHEVFMFYGWRLLLMAMLALPWIQYSLHVSREQARYPHFYRQLWLNALTLLIVFVANGLFWLVLLLWSEMFKLVGIPFFSTLFFDTDWFGYVAFGLITALAVVLARTQSRLVTAVQKLLTFIATGLLPLVALLALMFILTLPFTGLEAISQRVSAAGLMSTLTLLLLLLMAIVREPQKEALPYPGALRYLIKCSLIVAPIYMLIAGWSLWVRIQQYGWTPERLYGVLVVVVLLVWSFGYLASILRRGRNPLELQGPAILGVSLLALGLLVLLSSPVIDAWRISVNSHMGLYHSGKIKPDQVSLYMLDHSGKPGRAALEALQKDVAFNQDSKRRRDLNSLLQGRRDPVKELSATQLVSKVVMAPGSQKPDDAFWAFVKTQGYRITSCAEQNACVLVSQDLNADGHPEQVLYAFGDGESLVFGMQKNKWDLLAVATLPEGFTKDKLLQAVANQQLGSAPRIWRDITIDGKRLPMTYYTE